MGIIGHHDSFLKNQARTVIFYTMRKLLTIKPIFCAALFATTLLNASPVKVLSGNDLLKTSDTILVARVVCIDILKKDGKVWVVHTIDQPKTFKGQFDREKLWVEAFDDLSGQIGEHYDLPVDKQYVLFFLRDDGGGRYSHPVDPVTQGRFILPPSVMSQPSETVDSLLSKLATEIVRNPSKTDHFVARYLFPLLADHDSADTRKAFAAAETSDPEMAAVAVEARIKAGDLNVVPFAEKLLKRTGLSELTAKKLEILLEGIGMFSDRAKQRSERQTQQ